MDTPVCDFVRHYADANLLRLHMPGHKGQGPLGVEQLDITEIDGADSLYEAGGIIRRSEENAAALFGCRTFYSTEGSSQCIRAMLYLARMYAVQSGRKPLIAAQRNVHKTFLSAAALLDLEVQWLYPEQEESYLSCSLRAEQLEQVLRQSARKPAAVYLTSPDYLGLLADVEGIARVCHDHGVLLLVDNAHGAYLKFLNRSMHPVDLGADLCCSSAHKTLPVLTGGAYLHISQNVPAELAGQVRTALALFGSTSPSYLILQSLDAANIYLSTYPQKLNPFLQQVDAVKARLISHGYCLYGDEPLKLTLCAKPYGYTGTELARMLLEQGIVCEFADPDYLVLMLTPEVAAAGLQQLERVLLCIPRKPAIHLQPPKLHRGQRVLSIREAALSPAETRPVQMCEGSILAAASVSCPPAVPILICGERIDEAAIAAFRYYGIDCCTVVKTK